VPRQKSHHVDSAAALAARLREARDRAGLSQRALARGICTPAYISRLEKGERIPSLQLLQQLAERLDADAQELATGVTHDATDPLLDAELAVRLGEASEAAEAERLLAQTLEESDLRSQVRARVVLGQIAFERGQHRRVIELLEGLAPQMLDAKQSAAVADTLGRAYAMVGELESAIAVFERAHEVARSRNDALETIRFSVLLANALIDGGSYGKASEVLGHALAMTADSADPIIRARLWWSQSRLHANQNDSETAARYARRALETLELTENTTYTARAHQLLAQIELDRGNTDEAVRLLDAGYPLIVQSGNRYHIGLFRLEQARAFAQQGQKEEAAALAMDASASFADASPGDAGRAYALVAKVFADLGDRARALELYELADETMPLDSRYHHEITASRAELLEQEGRKDEALQLLKRAMGINTEARAENP
jgi:tetratricopeptide (TPR) repeat protein